jgi:hypothetical protein
MDPLERKIDRLSPEQRRETEDFVDFLLSRSGQLAVPQFISRPQLPARNVAPPPLTMIEPVHIAESQPSLPLEYSMENTRMTAVGDHAIPPVLSKIEGSDDLVSRDYMDYGQFEQRSPAKEAVRKVKAKLTRSEEQYRSNQLLDWID